MTLRIRASTADVHAPTGNTTAILTYAAVAGYAHVLGDGIAWSYDGTPTAGNLKIEDGAGNVVFSMDITAAGAGFVPLDPYKEMTVNRDCIVTLAAGGSGISGKVSALAHWTLPQV